MDAESKAQIDHMVRAHFKRLYLPDFQAAHVPTIYCQTRSDLSLT